MRSSGQARPETPVLFPSLRQAPVHHSPLYRLCGNRRHLWLMLPLLKSLRPAGYLAPPHHLCSLAFLRCCRVGTNSVTPINAFAASVEGLFPQMRLITETSPGSSAGAFLALLPRFPSLFRAGGLLCGSAWTVRQTRVSLRGYRSCEAQAAPHLRVGELPRMLPAGRVPDLPNWRRTAVGHTREGNLVDRDRRPETPSRGHVVPRRHRHRNANAAPTASR